MIKKKFQSLKVTVLKDQVDMMENKEENVNKRFLINGYILGFNNSSPEKIFKKYCSDCKSVLPLDNQKNYCCDEPMTIISHLVIHFKDKSLENIEKFVNLYQLTNDCDQNTFDLWGLLPKNRQAKHFVSDFRIGDKDQSFSEKLLNIMNSNAKANFVVEMMSSNSGRAYLKIYDTIFLPFSKP